MKILLTIDDNYELISFIDNYAAAKFIFCRKQFGYEYLCRDGTFGPLPNGDHASFSTLDEILNAFIAHMTQ